MNDEDDRAMEPGLSAGEVANDTQSVIDRIKGRRAARPDEETFDIPSWGGDLKARYKVLDRPEIEKMIKRARAAAEGNGSGSGTAADADFLIKACTGVVAIDPEDGETEHLLAPGYEMSLANVLEPMYPEGHPQAGQPVEIKDQRQLVIYLLRWNGIALAAHGQQVARWMQTMKKPIEDPQ